MKNNTIALILIFMISASVLISGCTDKENTVTEISSSDSKYGTGSAVILNHEMVAKDFGYLHVDGNVKNTGNSMLETADIRVKFYDENGAVVGEGNSGVYQIWPGETDDFSAIYQGGQQQLVTRSGNSYSIELVHPIYDNRD